MSNVTLTLSVLPERYAVCQLERGTGIPAWALNGPFFSVTQTPDELSIVCPETSVPDDARAPCERGWRALKLEGPFAFNLTGILLSVLEPLAEAGIGIFAISTYDTDYVLVKAEQLEPAMAALSERGHRIQKQHS